MDKENQIKHGNVETYADDMAKVLQNDTQGLVKKIIHEQEEKEEAKKNFSPDSRRNKMYMFLSFLLLLIAFVTLYILVTKDNINTVPIQNEFTPLIFNDESSFLEVAGKEKGEVLSVVMDTVNNSAVKQGGLEGIYLTENNQLIGLRRMISLLEWGFVPGPDNFVYENFLMGMVNNSSKDLFILVKVRELADVFPPLRLWEGTMFLDLNKLFGLKDDTGELATKEFEDGIIENKNARILKDSEGNIVLMYVFADNNSVIISHSNLATREVMSRIFQSNIKR